METNVGILPISFKKDPSGHPLITMKQGNPQFVPFRGDLEKLMWSIGLSIDDLHSDLPIVYGSTGTWTLLIPIKRLVSFEKMKPLTNEFPALLQENPRASIHPFCLETYDPNAMMHARHFSSPYSETIEDPVTGTASGVMAAYYLTYMRPDLERVSFAVEQGHEIGRDGRVMVEAIKQQVGQMDIFVSGFAVQVGHMVIETGT